MKKLFLLTLIFGLYTPTNAEQYPIHKYTCPKTGGECNEEERAVVKLVNDKYSHDKLNLALPYLLFNVSIAHIECG